MTHPKPIYLPTFDAAQIALELSQLPKRYSSYVFITDEAVNRLYGSAWHSLLSSPGAPVHLLQIPSGEQYKSLAMAENCWNRMLSLGVDRKALVIALGGGVITDLAGYVAGCYMRGLDCVYVPTTLLGMVDAAIGGKCGVNLAGGKNMIGLFRQPIKIFICLEYLASLPDREFRAGLAEVIKYAMMQDPKLFSFLERRMNSLLVRDQRVLDAVIRRCCAIKLDIVQKDPEDQTIRGHLNLGHTVAHALEAATQYSTYLHGEAVAIGLACEARISYELGLLDLRVMERLRHLCVLAGLPVTWEGASVEQLMDLMARDKKVVDGKLYLILPTAIGQVHKQMVDRKPISRALSLCQANSFFMV